MIFQYFYYLTYSQYKINKKIASIILFILSLSKKSIYLLNIVDLLTNFSFI